MRGVVLGGAFIILWWLSLLIVLPIGVKGPDEADEAVGKGHDPGAPVRVFFVRKLLVATAVAAVLWAVFYGLIRIGVIDI